MENSRYRLILQETKALKKDYKKLEKGNDLPRITEELRKFEADPLNQNTKKLISAGEEGTFRLRIGRYRVMYDIDHQNHIIIVHRIKQRQEGYR